MPIKSIAVHLADDAAGPDRVRFAVALAGRFGAHLDVVYTSPRIDMPAPAVGRAMSMGYIDAMAEEARGHVNDLLSGTEEVCRDHHSWQWHMGTATVEDVIARHAHLADLVVVEQPTEHSDQHASLIALEDYVDIAAGSPLLVVPAGWDRSDLGQRVLIAWQNAAESISAVRSSLNFFGEGSRAFVVADPDDPFADPPGSDLVAYLARHDVEAELAEARNDDAESLIDAATRHGCDLIVIGAIGRRGLKDLILGSTTDDVLRMTPVPLLMRR